MALRRFALAVFTLLALTALGTLGYSIIEGWGWLDSLFMTVITLTTTGYGEVHPLSERGRVFTIGLSLVGIFTVFYAATAIIRAIVSGEVQAALGRQRMERNLQKLRDHMIVCGFGRMGHFVCAEFAQRDLPFVVIDREPVLFDAFPFASGVALQGDATSDDVLRRAGVERARALVTVVASDADNLYITMSARLLNEKLLIVARAEDDSSEKKLLRAGASRAISPYVIGGTRVAHAVLRPAVVDFIELATRNDYLELQIEETQIAGGSALDGRSLAASRLDELELIVVAVKLASGKMVFRPPPDLVLAPGDTLIALGHRQNLDKLERLAGGSGG